METGKKKNFEEMKKFSLFRKLYYKLVLARSFELLVADLFRHKKLKHGLCGGIGQEAGGIAISALLKKSDILLSTDRGFYYPIGKGLSPRRILFELLGRKSDASGGMRSYVDPSKGVFGHSMSNGATFALAVGLALAIKKKKEKRVVVCVFGDGAASRGTFHGALNLSKIWRLPILWLCENNQFSFSTPFEKTSSVKNIADRAHNYNMPGLVIDGNDAIEIYKSAAGIIKRIRAEQEPALIELKTYRLGGHFLGDPSSFFVQKEKALSPAERPEFIYQKEEDVKYWLSRDPLRILGSKLGLSRDEVKTDTAKATEDLRNRLQDYWRMSQ